MQSFHRDKGRLSKYIEMLSSSSRLARAQSFHNEQEGLSKYRTCMTAIPNPAVEILAFAETPVQPKRIYSYI